MKKYYEIIKELREDREPKPSQKEIAKLLGTTQQYYSKYENGKRPLPIEHLKTLCVFYNVSADYILGLSEKMPFPKHLKMFYT